MVVDMSADPRERSAIGWAVADGLLAASAIGLVLVTAGADHPLYPTAVTFIIFSSIFPVHIRTVFAALRVKRETGESAAVLAHPWPPPFDKRLAYAVLAVYRAVAVLVFMSLPSIAGGQPEKHGDRYYLDDHGSLTRVSKAKYYAGEIGVDRLFLGLSAVFLGVGSVFNLRLVKDGYAAEDADQA